MPMTSDDSFLTLFRGNQNAVGTETGGCLRVENWTQQINAHLEGARPCGVYPVSEGRVVWGCIDWDQGEGDFVHARNVRNLLFKFNIMSWVERSRSKGFHLWVFTESWVPQSMMRAALLVACELTGAPSKEVNPKSMELREGELGNYVRLPYPGRQGVEGRRCFLDGDDEPMTYSHAMAGAFINRTHRNFIETLADRYTPKVSIVPKYTPTIGSTIRRLPPLGALMWHRGPFRDSDRSSQLYRFARLMVEHGKHTPYEMVQLVAEADLRWYADEPKYANRKDGLQRIGELVQQAMEA